MRPFTGIPLIGDVVTLSVEKDVCVRVLASPCYAKATFAHSLANYHSSSRPILEKGQVHKDNSIATCQVT